MITPNDPRLTAYVLGELDPADHQTVEAAIAESAELKLAVSELEQTCSLLKTSFASELPANATESLIQPPGVAVPAKPESPAHSRWRFSTVGWIVAATLLLAVTVAAMWPSGGWSRLDVSLTGEDDLTGLIGDIEGSSWSSADGPASEIADAGGLGSLDPGRSSAGSANTADKFHDLLEAGGVSAGEEIESFQENLEIPEDTDFASPANATEEALLRPDQALVAGKRVVEVQQSPDGGRVLMGGILVESNGRPRTLRIAPSDLPRTQIQQEEGKFVPSRGLDAGFDQNSFGTVLDSEVAGRRMGGSQGFGGDRYDPIIENAFLSPRESPLSTFSIDIDTASYSKVRSYLKNYQQLPPPVAVRIEELVNYFPYTYAPPVDDTPFAAHQSVVACPWNPEHKLVRVALKGREIPQEKRPLSNLVFLLDVSGSMNESNRLPLVKRGIEMLINQLGENDRVAMVVYAGAAGLVLDSTTGDQKTTLLGALERLSAGGSTNGGDGIRLAYQVAQDNFITGGINRVILCTDGDFNVGTTSTDELVGLVEEKARGNVFLTVLGFGMGNLNDAMLEQISNRGNGTYAFIDTDHEAHKVMVEQLSGTLQTIAKDVKIQIEFNPARVAAYRLIGYENRILAAEDFNNDRKDAGEIGAGHTVTALYEIVPAGSDALGAAPAVDDLKYQARLEGATVAEDNGELLTLKLRYKQPEGLTSQLLEFPLVDGNRAFSEADHDFQFAAAVAAFGMKLRGSQHAGTITWPAILEIAQSACGADAGGYRTEFVELVRAAAAMMGNR